MDIEEDLRLSGEELQIMNRLYNAIYNRNWELVNELLDQGISVHYRHPENGISTLYVAVARKAPLWVIKRLLREGRANPAQGDDRGFTLLHAACEYRISIDIVEYLLSVGANPNQPAEDGTTPMHFAAQYVANKSVLRALIRAGGDVNATKNNGATPLISAVENSAPASFVRILLEAGADPCTKLLNPRSKTYDTPVSLAKRKCTADVVAILEEAEHNLKIGIKPRISCRDLSTKIEKARLLFRHAVTSNSILVAQNDTVASKSDDFLLVRKGERVTLVHGSMEEGLHPPYEDYVLVCNKQGKAGKVSRSNLHDAASVDSV